MLFVKTKVQKTPDRGYGLFADQFIAKGSLIWRFHPGFDVRLAPADVAKLPETAQKQITRYCYVSQDNSEIILCCDDTRFMNHADDANTTSTGYVDGQEATLASRDIQSGEEITGDYFEFDKAAAEKLRS